MNSYCVFTLADSQGLVHYAGIGQAPAFAVELWRGRSKTVSPLNDWLASLPSMPTVAVVAHGLSEGQAEELLAVVRRQLKDSNTELLSSRPIDTFVTGGGRRLGCVIDGTYYDSQRTAANSLNKSVATISRRIANVNDTEAYRADETLKALLQ